MTNQNIKLAELKKHQYIFGTEILQIPRKILILNCLHIYKWNIPAKKCFNYLNKQRNAVETSYNSSVVCLSCQNMECANTPINNVFHSDAINHHTLPRPPLHILMRTHHKLNKLWQASMLTDRSMIERAKGKISHETNNSLDERPTGWWVKQFY